MMRNKINHVKKSVIICLIMVCMSAILCGAKTAVELDTQSRVVYESIGTDKIFKDFSNDDKVAKSTYSDNYYLLYGKVLSKSKNNKEIVLGAIDGKSSNKLTCKFSDKDDIKFVSSLSISSTVRVYGKLTVGLKNALTLKEIKGISKVDAGNVADGAFSVLGGRAIKKTSMKKTAIEGSNTTFYVPSEWQNVEHDIKKEQLGSMSGYQYRLNEIENKDAYAESLFVCYFDKISGVDKNDRGDNKLIEEAILRDILGKDSLKKFPLKTVNTYYGTKYKYYRDSYKKDTGEKYQVEVVFQEKGDGIIVFFYVYKEPKHVGDIMVVMRMLES